MSLPFWVEYLLTVPRKNSSRIGTLVKQVGSEYYFPIVPPATEAFITTDPALAIPPAYGGIFYRLELGDIVPNAFTLTVVTRGGRAFSGRVQGNVIQAGIDYFFVHAPGDNLTVFLTNITPINQMFQMYSQYLRIETEPDYYEVMEILSKFGLYAMPTRLP